MVSRRCILFIAALATVAGPARGTAAGRCAYVDVDTLMPTEPKQQCFKLDMTCGADEKYGCFEAPLAFKSGWVDGKSRAKLRELSARKQLRADPLPPRSALARSRD